MARPIANVIGVGVDQHASSGVSMGMCQLMVHAIVSHATTVLLAISFAPVTAPSVHRKGNVIVASRDGEETTAKEKDAPVSTLAVQDMGCVCQRARAPVILDGQVRTLTLL